MTSQAPNRLMLWILPAAILSLCSCQPSQKTTGPRADGAAPDAAEASTSADSDAQPGERSPEDAAALAAGPATEAVPALESAMSQPVAEAPDAGRNASESTPDQAMTAEDEPRSASSTGAQPPEGSAQTESQRDEESKASTPAPAGASAPSGSSQPAAQGSGRPASEESPEGASASAPSNPLLYDLRNNPATQAARGAPSILDPMRPCVWFSVDGREGRMQQGKMQWLIEEPVSPRPTIVIRTVPQVLGEPVKVRVALIRLEEDPQVRGLKADEKWLYFLESRQDGAVKAGIPYPLCSSGDLFTYTNKAVSEGGVVPAMPNLPAGTYELVADVVGTLTKGEKTLAVTRFTVSAGP